MENAAKEHELEVSSKIINCEEEKLYGLFEDVFGEDSADDMPETAAEIENHFLSELCRHHVGDSQHAERRRALPRSRHGNAR